MTIGERLKQWRKENKYTTIDISEKTGISQSAISDYENNKKAIGSNALIALNDSYNIDINWLLTGVKDENIFTDDEYQIIQYYRLCDNKTKEQILNFILFCYANQNNASTNEGNFPTSRIG